jgi:hypothetical protein
MGASIGFTIWTNEKLGKYLGTNESLPVSSALHLELLHEGGYLKTIIWTNEKLGKYLGTNESLPVSSALQLELLHEGGNLVVGLDEAFPGPPVHSGQTN